MKAIQLFAKGELRLTDLPEPEIAPDEVLLACKVGAICGTDLRMFANGHRQSPQALTLGHELSGVIEKVGANVSPEWRVGMRVAVAPNYGCGTCDSCISGNTQTCKEFQALGIQKNGAFARYVVIPARAVQQGNIVALPDHVSFEEGALIEPFSCVYNAFERCHTRVGDTVLVIGAGPIGLMHAMLHKAAGAGKVLISDINPERLAMACNFDPDFVPVSGTDTLADVMRITQNRGCDVVITAASIAEIQSLAFELTALNGRVLFFGGLPHGKEMVRLNTNIIHYRQITVTGMSGQNLRQYRESLRMISNGLINLKEILTHKYTLEQYDEAFSAARSGEALKVAFVL